MFLDFLFKNKSDKKLDPAVKAMTSQIQDDYDIPVIIAYKKRSAIDQGHECLSTMGCSIKHALPVIKSLATTIKHSSLEELLNNRDVAYVFLDAPVRGVLDIAGKTLHARWAHKEKYTGKGVTVAVIDTGIAPHSDLTRPTNRIVGFKDLVNDRSMPYDDEGHGTHVAGIIAGNGFSSGGRYRGIAPHANLVGVKVMDSSGSGTISDVVAGMQWVLDNKKKYNIKIANLSLGSAAKHPASRDPICQAANKLWQSGVAVVAAAGNDGPDTRTINSPGITPSIITVGAIDDRKEKLSVPDFTSRGPTIDGVPKPDLVTPGVDITSLKAKGGYKSESGTSMATPMVSGAAALLYQKYPKLTPMGLKRRLLMSTTKMRGNGVESAGRGLLNLETLLKDRKQKRVGYYPINYPPRSK